ncbi:Asp23/Gls24 family envelope stress response protein [Amycolatopsis mongoliensis]|uniref:Asp23/Gls24 family envelope stress response protein n=1 Tax=Amycolatopsis mongoliensis TaxID=715475 RepID=A0A9Y2NHF2_9PSEU|nr:Asp23/Gls24 family envelope stress response protein [Amycolatopsis sp. 4-36]WIX98139.1 Asp23/Gls24 family envelope stress response protein [Amycolatopsis sp. 4-36]
MTVHLPEAAERGRTTVAPLALERIAAQAAAEIVDVGGSARRMAGVAWGTEKAEQAVRVQAVVDGDLVNLVVHLSLGYSVPVAAAADAVRAHLLSRISELTGKTVGRVDIAVTALHTAHRNRVLR